jgi:hypothetical protein
MIMTVKAGQPHGAQRYVPIAQGRPARRDALLKGVCAGQ